MQEDTPVPTKVLICISLLQGLALLLLHQSIDYKFWPHNAPQWLFAFYALAITGPTLCLLGLKTAKAVELLKWILPFTAIDGLVGFYIGLQATPIEHISFESLLFGLVLTMAIASFKVLMYGQQHISGKVFSYSQLFDWSWRNFLTLSLSLLFALCFWGILMLWAGLFKAIKINFFFDIFTEKWFFYPALSLAHGFGIVIFRNQSKIIDTIKSLQQALMKYLLIVIILVSILFLSALPFSGLESLWDSGGSSLILWMQTLILFFVNAVYQDHPDHRPYNVWLHRFIYLGVGLLPIYSLISFYGLSLRVEQYGWSVARCWAILIWFLLALFSLGYLWGILKLRDNWLNQLSKINIIMGVVVWGFMVAVNSPLLDFRKISVSSQLSMLAKGEVTLDSLDVQYFKNQLARPGYEALERLKQDYANTNPMFTAKVKRIYSRYSDKDIGLTQEEFVKQIQVISGDIPESLKKSLYENIQGNRWMLDNMKAFYLMSIDWNDDGQDEYLFIKENESINDAELYFLNDSQWERLELNGANYNRFDKKTLQALKDKNFELVAPKWKQLKVNGLMFQIKTK